MYICLCNALTDKRLKQAVADGHNRVGDVYAACGCRAQCGQCVQTVLRLVREAASGPQEELQGAV
ncbi:MAG TPA: (2Fe-2S)-binding protein [Rhodopila sp.]|nr:(2Fe-2S)-binding protein [Rhodopila sp.]